VRTVAPFISIEHLRKRFGAHAVLDDVNLDVERGEVVSIIGQSGMGKSIILKHIIGLVLPDGGRILLDGEEVSSPTKRPADFEKVRKRFGMLFQGAALFDSKTVGENIAFPLREHTRLSAAEIAHEVADALMMVGLQDIQNKMSSELSGGMRSRVGLARALAMKPEIMLYDEPTSALDPITSDKISDLVLELKQKLGMTSIVVTHDMNSAYRISDKIAMIHEGKIIFFGTPAEIRASRNPYIQQFISGRRKLHYAVTADPEEKAALDQQVDVTRMARRSRNAEILRQMKTQPAHDALTGILTGGSLRQRLEELYKRGLAGELSFAVAAGVVEHYPTLSARHGEEFGRAVLRWVAHELRDTVRGDSDLVGRHGESSFLLVVVSPDARAILEPVDRVRLSVAHHEFTVAGGERVPVTMSFGLTAFRPTDASVDALLARAEDAVAAAGQAGGDRTEVR
jgi:phospholipid/cholesterol/gamma-HCH transport system ATP-binding protein